MDPAVREHLQEHRVLPRRPRHRDPAIGPGLGEVKDVRTVDEHGRRGVTRVEAPRVHLADVEDESGLGDTRLGDERDEPRDELVVGERFDRPFECHARMVGRRADTIGPRLTESRLFSTGLCDRQESMASPIGIIALRRGDSSQDG
jgi:hypothetical protein